jgi:GNAT superfamily N-acetyltransferase
VNTTHINLDNFNRECFCVSLDEQALARTMAEDMGDPALFDLVRDRLPLMFSLRPVVLSQAQVQRMARLISALESVVALPTYREEVLSRSDPIARHPLRAKSVFMGYDFHVHGDAQGAGFGLIEVNTNAGGALLNALLARAQRACCPEIEAMVPTGPQVDALEAAFVAMFQNEWRLSQPARALKTVAIVDVSPEQQYLYPEFLLFQNLFKRHGLQAFIADPAQLVWRDQQLWCDGVAIDLVYNRLTDFALTEPAHAHLREAYLQDAVVLTPHPQAHALLADKRNLALLCNTDTLTAMGVPEATQAVLREGIPHTEVVTPANAERFWAQRKQFFFKPFAGYGGKAAYRGDKLTHRVWAEIAAGGYIAQALVAPGERTISGGESAQVLKFDVRNYVYDGQVQSLAARLYQGQTTNFRTPGGGFAPVYVGV